MKDIKTVGIIGFGVMGAAIGINAAFSGYNVIFKELNEDLVQSMYDTWVIKALNKRVAKNKITQKDMDEIAGRIKGTCEYEDLNQCDLIIEAAVENLDLKIKIFGELSSICPEDTIMVSNTSTFLIEKVMEKVLNPARTAGLHYFFPANVNRLVEVIRQKDTSDDTFNAVNEFALKNKKTVISVKDFPGFAINPVFISSYMVLNSFYGDYNVASLDDISKEALGVRFGIMWVQNMSGLGTAFHAANSMVEYLHNSDVGYPTVPEQLETCFNSGSNWDLVDGPIVEDKDARQKVMDTLLGTIFTISTHLVQKEIVSAADLELGIKTALAWPEGPFAMMNRIGMEKTREMIALVCDADLFKMPAKFKNSTPDQWDI